MHPNRGKCPFLHLFILDMIRVILSFLFVLGMLPTLHASALDSVRISLLTCAPGTEIYALFGHSAIRYVSVGGLLHIDEDGRGAQNAARVGIVPFGAVGFGIVHGGSPNSFLKVLKKRGYGGEKLPSRPPAAGLSFGIPSRLPTFFPDPI